MQATLELTLSTMPAAAAWLVPKTSIASCARSHGCHPPHPYPSCCHTAAAAHPHMSCTCQTLHQPRSVPTHPNCCQRSQAPLPQPPLLFHCCHCYRRHCCHRTRRPDGWEQPPLLLPPALLPPSSQQCNPTNLSGPLVLLLQMLLRVRGWRRRLLLRTSPAVSIRRTCSRGPGRGGGWKLPAAEAPGGWACRRQ
jgi:hypothetical protein